MNYFLLNKLKLLKRKGITQLFQSGMENDYILR